MPIWQLCANLLIPNCLRSNLSYSPLAALELYVNSFIAVIVLLVIASLVVRYLPLYHSTSPHPELNIPCGADLLLPYIRLSSVLPFLQSLPCVRVFHLISIYRFLPDCNRNEILSRSNCAQIESVAIIIGANRDGCPSSFVPFYFLSFLMLIYSFITDYQAFNLRYKDNTARDKNETKVGKQSAILGNNNEPI